MARSFNGTSDIIVLANAISIAANHDFASSVWVYPTLGTAGYYVAQADTTGASLIVYVKGTTNSNAVAVYFGGTSVVDPGSLSCPQNQWSNIIVTGTMGTTQTMTVYVNGSSAGSKSSTWSMSSVTPRLGYDGAQTHWLGNMADAAIWDFGSGGGVLSGTDIARIVAGVRPASVRSASLLYWLPLDGYASPETDLSGNANNGTLTGTARVLGPPPLWHVYGS